MQIRTALLAIIATSALSAAALAAPAANQDINLRSAGHPTSREAMADRCSALESQYDGAILGRPGAGQAAALHALGVDQCNADNGNLGVTHLQQSLRDLGLKPSA